MKKNYLTPSVKIRLREKADVMTVSFTSTAFDDGDHIVGWDGESFTGSEGGGN